MKFQGKLRDISIDYQTKKPIISFLVSSNINSLEEIENENTLDIEAIKPKRKRSLNANNYCWKLITEIGNKLRLSKEEVYLKMLKEYGQSEMVSVLSEINVTGYFNYFDIAGTSILNGKEFTHYKIYKGSSEYDTKEMSIFIDGIVQEAQELGIVTDTPEQIKMYKENWRNK